MQDPNPSNITGSKVHQHTVNWEVNVGHLVAGLALIYVAAKFGPPLLDAASGSGDDQEEHVDVEVMGEAL